MIEFIRRVNTMSDPDGSGTDRSESSRHEQIKVEHIRDPSIVLSHVLDDSREGDSDMDHNQGHGDELKQGKKHGKLRLNVPQTVNNVDLASPMHWRKTQGNLLRKQASLHPKHGSKAAPLMAKPLLQK